MKLDLERLSNVEKLSVKDWITVQLVYLYGICLTTLFINFAVINIELKHYIKLQLILTAVFIVIMMLLTVLRDIYMRIKGKQIVGYIIAIEFFVASLLQLIIIVRMIYIPYKKMVSMVYISYILFIVFIYKIGGLLLKNTGDVNTKSTVKRSMTVSACTIGILKLLKIYNIKIFFVLLAVLLSSWEAIYAIMWIGKTRKNRKKTGAI